jgi:hypothetical protein
MTPVTIERTSKRWKAAKLIGWAMFWIGLIMVFFSPEQATKDSGAHLFLLSIPWLIVARIGRWWVNG